MDSKENKNFIGRNISAAQLRIVDQELEMNPLVKR